LSRTPPDLKPIHDRTLERFVADRIGEGVRVTTINGGLKVLWTVLNRAARSYARGHPPGEAVLNRD
jgi:hypothetical protein